MYFEVLINDIKFSVLFRSLISDIQFFPVLFVRFLHICCSFLRLLSRSRLSR